MTRFFKTYARLIVLSLVAVVAFDPSFAHARAGSGSSMGSRGARTYMAPPPTRTVPQQAAPIQRSVTPPAPQYQAPPQPAFTPQPQFNSQPSWFQRNPFLGGMMGGLVGSGIAGMLFGHGYGYGMGGGMGFAGGLGMLLQFLIIGGIGWWIYSMFRNRGVVQHPPVYAAEPFEQPHYNAPYPGVSRIPQVDLPPYQNGGYQASPQGTVLHQDELGIGPQDFTDFEHTLTAVQQAWSKSDIAALRRLVTPEMLSYFSEMLAANASKGIANTVSDVTLEQGDLAESWREGNIEYATVGMRFSAHDYDTSLDDNRIVGGSKDALTTATETWTFMRQANGGKWLLSAIQQ